MKLWDKGFSIDKKIEKFTVGNDREVDIHIAYYDIVASLAHAEMLKETGFLTADELHKISAVLNELQQQIQDHTFIIDTQFEDVHSKIEFELIQKLGEVGKKIHTARSRNDQVLVALQLYYKDHLQHIKEKVKSLFNVLISLSEKYKENLLPGYTHLQVAMPSSFGLWFSAYAEVLIDDLLLFNTAIQTVDQNPLGSAAGYGSSFSIDRELTTKLMDFSTLKYNVVASQLSRGKSERTIAMALGSINNTLARFAMDICLYNSQNFGFISFPDELTTGSSIMPHKKNPDVFELIRGKSNKIQALYSEMVLITNNLPSGYHRDFQLLKEPIINAIEDTKDILDIFTYAISQVDVLDIDLSEEKYKYLFTVDSIADLITEGYSFRDAYKKIGEEVQNNTYKVENPKRHTHIGSIHNLALDRIQEKFNNFYHIT